MAAPITLNWYKDGHGVPKAGVDPDYPFSGGDANLRWKAQYIGDGARIIVWSDNFTFETPERLAFINDYLPGWMKNSADGSRFVDHTVTTVTGTETIDAQDPAATSRRSVFTYNGKKYFKSNLIIGDADLANSGFINYYAGRELSPGDRVVFYSRVRVNQTSGDTSVQWQFKGARFGKGPSEQYDPDNSCYLKIAPSTNGTAVDDYHGATSRSLFYSGGPNRAGALVDELFFWKQNTPDGDDGYQLTLGANGASFTRDIPYISGAPNTGTSVIKSSHANRTDHLKVQDYCANGSGIGVEVLRGDTMFQVNGSVFAICDSVSEGSRTRFQALPPVEIIAPNMWAFTLDKGAMPNYTGASLVLLDKNNMAQLAGVVLS